MSFIKICGLRRQEDIEAVNEGLPDFIGFVFAKSKRQITPKQAYELRRYLDPSIKAVGVFVNESPEKVQAICVSGTIDIVQLHGDEDEVYINKLRDKTKCPIIKAIRVKSREDLLGIENLTCDYMLLDAWDKNQYGGSGKSFDWTQIGKLPKPFFLAGGLNADNLVTAAKMLNPYCLDLSSGVETDGYKDKNKVINAINIVRSVT